MRRSLGPLLCELHAHTRWSDGELTVAELLDLHGRSGFDILCVKAVVIGLREFVSVNDGIAEADAELSLAAA